jgi:arylmalonate decarboxylase
MITISRRDFARLSAAGIASASLLHAAADPVVGLIFPPNDNPIPPDAKLLYPKGVTFLGDGVGLERMTTAEYDRVVPNIVPAALRLKKAGATAISIMGTSLTFYKGAAYNQKLIDDVKKATGLPSTSMSTGIVDGLKTAGAKRIAVATAYQEEVNKLLRVFLEQSGFEVLGIKGLGIEKFDDAHPVTRETLLKFSSDTFAAFPKADSLLISCGKLQTLDLIVPLEKSCKVSVVSSTPHALRNAVRLAGLSGKAMGYGTVLAKG